MNSSGDNLAGLAPACNGLSTRASSESESLAAEDRFAFGVAAVHAVQHQAVKVNVEIGRRAKSLYQRDRAAISPCEATGAALASTEKTEIRRWRAELWRQATAGIEPAAAWQPLRGELPCGNSI